ncbi:peptide chain release factor N(5)-glutamine methyltransferase [Fluviispira multicolorata]|uniref:Peptide chain release factor N(5)-glutamine methyltransferase n=1 Tax=Fluviispira multicolorata TaxID=2654512 RepID=A0A833JAX9_9BACT|nr:peptide chain release factor N(5)-glutamine methyltransferase [Fluviispira multicolorata]KAB8028500.1 peptide chain release factor N(5)-glutamine methyltransferase [Fluviispira multicolorata]
MHVEQEKKEQLWTVREILNWTTKRFNEKELETPLLDAQLLLCKVLNFTKIQLYIEMDKPLNEQEKSQFRTLVKRRLSGEPVAYILNEKYWHNLKLFVDKRVLIPRPETESILDFILQNKKNSDPKIILDLCTGSGCLAIALAKEFPNAQVIGVDISNDALAVAKINAELNSVNNIEWLNADVSHIKVFQELKSKYNGFDIIVANPPYVTENEWLKLTPTVKEFEPKLALVALDEGLIIGFSILKNIEDFSLLSSHAIFAMEMADKQPQKLKSEITKIIQYNHPAWDIPINEWFTLCDWERKERFLLHVGS